MLVACRLPRCALALRASQPRPFDNHPVRALLTAFMVQTRGATRLTARDESKHTPDVKRPTNGEPTQRTLKRARNAHKSDARAPSAAATQPKEPERESQ